MNDPTVASDYFLYELPVMDGATIVRRLSCDDLDAFSAYRSDPELARYQEWESMSRTQARVTLERASTTARFVHRSWVQLGIADDESNPPLGDLGIFLNTGNREAEIGFTLSRFAQGKGHAWRAVRIACRLVFSHTGADTVKAITDTRNTASIRLLEASGFEQVDEVDAVFKGEHCREAIYKTHSSNRS